MENKDEWSLINKVGEVNPLTTGADSSVFVVSDKKNKTNIIAKEYDKRKFNHIDVRNIEKILRQYYIDTEKAIEIVQKNPNPLHQAVKIRNETFNLEYKIEPQGSIMLERTKKVDFYDRYHRAIIEENRPVKTLLGQKFIDGLNLDLLKMYHHRSKSLENINFEITPEQKIFVDNIGLCLDLEGHIEKLISYISKELNVYFESSTTNIKPFLNERDKKIILVITDLAAELNEYYTKSPKFIELRNKK